MIKSLCGRLQNKKRYHSNVNNSQMRCKVGGRVSRLSEMFSSVHFSVSTDSGLALPEYWEIGADEDSRFTAMSLRYPYDIAKKRDKNGTLGSVWDKVFYNEKLSQ